MAGNLLDNACKWANRRVRVTVIPNAATLRARPFFCLRVEDDGPGLPEEARAAVMKRGTRLDESKPGSGLGLSIVTEIAELYGGEVRLDKSPLGGLRADLYLPAAAG